MNETDSYINLVCSYRF